ncbi:MAG: hypothetical protein AAF411_21110 [Myxococcota bacterium]
MSEALSPLESHIEHHVERWAIYDAAVYAAWLDDELKATEVEGARAVASLLALDGPHSLAGPMLRIRASEGVDARQLSPGGRRAAFATAAWICAIDGPYTAQEERFLRTLESSLELNPHTAEFLAELARFFAAVTNRREAYDALIEASVATLSRPH